MTWPYLEKWYVACPICDKHLSGNVFDWYCAIYLQFGTALMWRLWPEPWTVSELEGETGVAGPGCNRDTLWKLWVMSQVNREAHTLSVCEWWPAYVVHVACMHCPYCLSRECCQNKMFHKQNLDSQQTWGNCGSGDRESVQRIASW